MLWLGLVVLFAADAQPVDRRYRGSTATRVQVVQQAGSADAPAPSELEVEAAPAAPPTASDTADEAEGDVEVVRVKTEKLGDSTRADAFKHAGGRSIVTSEEWSERGSASVSEVLDRVPGVRSVEGIAGIGSTSTKLNVAVRGSNPRLSSSATVLLDEIPLAVAPYGQPELSLFPVSLFSIDRIDAVLGGASVRFGPQTSGGVFNLISKPIPTLPQWSIASQIDQFGQVNLATGFGTTVGKFGVYVEYAPQLGQSFRENSDVNAHGGLLKLRYEFSPRLEVQSLSHGYWEHSGIPGGLSLAAYREDPFQSTRDEDYFEGWRVGEAVKVIAHPHPDHALQANIFYNHSVRETRLLDDRADEILTLPRTYDAFGVEPRYTGRLAHKSGAYHMLSAGFRGTFEAAHLLAFRRPERTGGYEVSDRPSQDRNGRIGALAAFVEDELHLLDESLVLRAGVRLEVLRTSIRDNQPAVGADPENAGILSRTFIEPLPAASIWYSPQENLAAFFGYQRSYGPPTFVQMAAALNADANRDLRSEYTHTIEGGLKLFDRYGVWANATGFYRWFRNIRDIGENSVGVEVDAAWARGLETEMGWEPGEVWEALTGSELYVGHASMQSLVTQGLVTGQKELPWYPRMEVWGGLTYAFPWHCGLGFGSGPADCRAWRVGADVEWSAEQYTDYQNREAMDLATGEAGLVPAYTLLNLHTTVQAALPGAWVVNITLGVKNALDEEWFFRTDDVNRGILPQRPRTFYVRLDLSHFFLRAYERAQTRRERRQEARAGR